VIVKNRLHNEFLKSPINLFVHPLVYQIQSLMYICLCAFIFMDNSMGKPPSFHPVENKVPYFHPDEKCWRNRLALLIPCLLGSILKFAAPLLKFYIYATTFMLSPLVHYVRSRIASVHFCMLLYRCI